MAIRGANFDVLKIDRLSRDFGSHAALRDVDLTIRKGEFIALLGPSGCGKSTTLNIVAGLLPATGGGIWLDDKRIDQLRPEERGFGMVFQNYALFPHLNVRKNIGFGLKMRGRPRAEIERRVDEAIALVRLNGQDYKLPGQMSGGQQQRVAIARAVVIEPPLVLMDEPLSNLDAKLRLEMRAEIRRIHNSLGAITIYVTHDQEEALSLADRIVVMRDGVVRQIGTPDELFARPNSVEVAEFMGFRNRLTGKVVARDGERATVRVDGADLAGIVRDDVAVGDAAVVAVRPEDLTALEGAPLTALTVSSEFRGNSFIGIGTATNGVDLWFASSRALKPGEQVRLGANPDKLLVFRAAAT